MAVAGQAFVPLVVRLGPLDIPLTDLGAGGLAVWWFWRAGSAERRVRPGPVGWLLAALVAQGLLSAWANGTDGALTERVHDWARWPLFNALVYGWGARRWMEGRPRGELVVASAAWVVGLTLLTLAAASYRIGGGGLTFIHVMLPLVHNHKSLAQAVVPMLPLFWVPLWRQRRGRWLLGLILLGVLSTISRTAWIGLLAAWWVWDWTRSEDAGRAPPSATSESAPRSWTRALLRHRLTAPLATVAGVAAVFLVPGYVRSMALTSSTDTRIWLWLKSLALMRAHPWFGVGPGAFVAHTAGPHQSDPVVAALGPHSALQTLGAEYGLPAVALGGALLMLVLRRLWAAPPRWRRPLLASGVALGVQLLFSTDTWTCMTWWPWAVLLALAAERRGDRVSPDTRPG